MTDKSRPIPTDHLGPKQSGGRKTSDVNKTDAVNRKLPNSAEQGQSANTRQNTRHQGYQQDR